MIRNRLVHEKIDFSTDSFRNGLQFPHIPTGPRTTIPPRRWSRIQHPGRNRLINDGMGCRLSCWNRPALRISRERYQSRTLNHLR